MTESPTSASIDRLRLEIDEIPVYSAGLPHFRSNFSRDGILSAFLFRDAQMLKSQLLLSGKLIGAKYDSRTGEEPGKIFHEYPEVVINGKSTLFNACDTAALFILGHVALARDTGNREFFDAEKDKINQALQYITIHTFRHGTAGLFEEDPALCGADSFALKVTYWKDSALVGRAEGVPQYPVCFTLAHIQAFAAVRELGEFLNSEDIIRDAEVMLRALEERLVDKETGGYFLALDAQGPVRGVTSDLVHALYYLRPGDISEERIKALVNGAKSLETEAGYRTMSPDLAALMEDPYHAKTVWPFEQAFIHAGAMKFGLQSVAEIAARVKPYLSTEYEILILSNDPNQFIPGGCCPQLWSLGAELYFRSVEE